VTHRFCKASSVLPGLAFVAGPLVPSVGRPRPFFRESCLLQSTRRTPQRSWSRLPL